MCGFDLFEQLVEIVWMLFWTLAVTMPIYAGALYMSYQESARGLEAGAERDVDEIAARLAAGLDTVIRPIEGGIRTVASQLEEVDPPADQYPLRIRGILAAWPEVYGSTIAIEADDGGAGAKPFAPYLFRRAGAIAYSDLATDQYRYRELSWYRRAADGNQPVWSLPYFDAGGGETWMVTYSVPFYRKGFATRSRRLPGEDPISRRGRLQPPAPTQTGRCSTASACATTSSC